jgi:serine/threonine protein kinase
MGVLYRARDTRLGRTVAIKLLHPGAVPDPERARRFLLEAKAASSQAP